MPDDLENQISKLEQRITTLESSYNTAKTFAAAAALVAVVFGGTGAWGVTMLANANSRISDLQARSTAVAEVYQKYQGDLNSLATKLSGEIADNAKLVDTKISSDIADFDRHIDSSISIADAHIASSIDNINDSLRASTMKAIDDKISKFSAEFGKSDNFVHLSQDINFIDSVLNEINSQIKRNNDLLDNINSKEMSDLRRRNSQVEEELNKANEVVKSLRFALENIRANSSQIDKR